MPDYSQELIGYMDPYIGCLLGQVSRTCPDGGTCHHQCSAGPCFRVITCGPLSGTYPGDQWPAEIRIREDLRYLRGCLPHARAGHENMTRGDGEDMTKTATTGIIAQLSELDRVLNGPEDIIERVTRAQVMVKDMIGNPPDADGNIPTREPPGWRPPDMQPAANPPALEPWPIANAISCLKEARDRKCGDTERERTIKAAMNYAIEVVKSINSLREPQPPSPEELSRRAVRTFCKELGLAVENLGRAFQDVASEDMPWEQ